MSRIDVTPSLPTIAPIGGVVSLADLAPGDIAWFGDDDIGLAVDHEGRPVVPDSSETEQSRWICESTGPGMFEVMGTLPDRAQGPIVKGSLKNWVLLTDTYIRGSIPEYRAQLRTTKGIAVIPYGCVYTFAMPLLDIEVIDGNKNDIAVGSRVDALHVQWVNAADSSWSKAGSKNLWARNNASFARAVLDATIAVKRAHSDDRVRTSGDNAVRTQTHEAFGRRKRTTVEFAAPSRS